MPWKAVPPDRSDITKALPSKYAVLGVPTLLMFSPSGELLTSSGVDAVKRDPEGKKFPWAGHSGSLLSVLMPMIQMGLLCLMVYVAVKAFIK